MSLLRKRSEKMKILWKILLTVVWIILYMPLQLGVYSLAFFALDKGFIVYSTASGIAIMLIDMFLFMFGFWLIWRRYK